MKFLKLIMAVLQALPFLFVAIDKQTGVKAIYDRNKYLPKMLEGYLAWEAHLRELGLK